MSEYLSSFLSMRIGMSSRGSRDRAADIASCAMLKLPFDLA